MIALKNMRVALAAACLVMVIICLSSLSTRVADAEEDIVSKGLVDSECCKDVKIPLLLHREDAETACFQCCMDKGHKMWYTTLKACHCSDQTPGSHAK